MATDDNVADSVKLTAIRDALDRGGVVAKTAVEVGISVKPYEAILDRMESGSRAEFRRSQGIEDSGKTPKIALVAALRADDDDDLIVEGEVLLDVDVDDEVDGDLGEDDGGSAAIRANLSYDPGASRPGTARDARSRPRHK